MRISIIAVSVVLCSCTNPHQYQEEPDAEVDAEVDGAPPPVLVVECLAGEERCRYPEEEVLAMDDPNLELGHPGNILIVVGNLFSPGAYIEIGAVGNPVCIVETDGSAGDVRQGVLWCAYGIEAASITCREEEAFCDEVAEELQIEISESSNVHLTPGALPGTYTRLGEDGAPVCNAIAGESPEEAARATRWCLNGLSN